MIRILRTGVIAFAVIALFAGAVYGIAGDPNYHFVKSTKPVKLMIDVPNVRYDFDGSTVNIPFTLKNARAHIWLAVYTTGANPPAGFGGPGKAIWRKAGLDTLVYVKDQGQFNEGPGKITWDGKDWNGKPVAKGTYTLYLFGLDDLDDSNLIGPGSMGHGYGRLNLWVDPNKPGDCWAIPTAEGSGTTGFFMYRVGEFDWIKNPTAVKPIPVPSDLYNGLSHWFFPGDRFTGYSASIGTGGITKFHIRPDLSGADPDPDFGVNGKVDKLTDNVNVFQGIRGLKDKIYVSHGGWNTNPPVGEVFVLDAKTGKTLETIDVSDYFVVTAVDPTTGQEVRASQGPAVIDVDESGIYLCNGGWGTGADGGPGNSDFGTFCKVDLEGNPIWVNNNGDGFGDTRSKDTAERLGLPEVHQGVQCNWATPKGFSAILEVDATQASTSFGAVIGPDGSGIHHLNMIKSPPVASQAWQNGLAFIEQDSDYDGIYYFPTDATWNEASGQGPLAIAHAPYDIAEAVIGPEVVTAVEEVETKALPGGFNLGQAFPNPFNSETTIEFALPTTAYTTMNVYDVSGQLVTILVDKELKAGNYRVKWDGKDSKGVLVSSGMYMYTIKSGQYSETKKMTLLK